LYFKILKKYSFLFFIFFILLGISAPSFSLQPEEILVLVNTKNVYSLNLARYYMHRRKIPDGNMVRLRLDDSEIISFKDYQKKVEIPVRNFITNHKIKDRIKCLLLMYGMPLEFVHPDIEFMGEKTKNASLDSELALLFDEFHDLSGWQPNPFYIGYGKKYEAMRSNVMMVCRLDGSYPKIVKRIIDDSIEVEESGLTGKAYFDARWKVNKSETKKTGYRLYDNSIRVAAGLLKEKGLMPVRLDETNELFQKGECPDAALYCGWYSLRKYVNAFTWKKGSVGYHIASAECTTLKTPASEVWCKRMLEEGIAATLGPVNEPYAEAFPLPELFFRFLTDGYYTLAECYAITNPFWSWQMILIGDPLYNPFKNSQN
jgi:uncharacterized protein (TIGR03790 family)